MTVILISRPARGVAPKCAATATAVPFAATADALPQTSASRCSARVRHHDFTRTLSVAPSHAVDRCAHARTRRRPVTGAPLHARHDLVRRATSLTRRPPPPPLRQPTSSRTDLGRGDSRAPRRRGMCAPLKSARRWETDHGFFRGPYGKCRKVNVESVVLHISNVYYVVIACRR